MGQFHQPRLTQKYYSPIEDEINKILWESIYKPIADILNKTKLENAKVSRLAQAIKSGKIFYEKDIFKGSFSATTSRKLIELGAKYNKTKKGFVINRELLPVDLLSEIEIMKQKAIALHEDVIESLQIENIEKSLKDSNLEGRFNKTTGFIDYEWRKAAKVMGVVPDFTDDDKEKISSNYTANMELYIQEWSEKNIKKLRATIVDNMNTGARASQLSKEIMKNYGVSKNKAIFLAKQETSLLLVEFNENRATTAGITKFKWSDSGDGSVRSDHHRLNGKIFFYSNPPVINTKTGETGLPGQAYGCRCIAINIF